MAVLNPPRSLPGLGRAIVNYLLDARRNWTEDDLVAAFKPEGLNPAAEAAGGLKNTMSALRAINVLEADADGALGSALRWRPSTSPVHQGPVPPGAPRPRLRLRPGRRRLGHPGRRRAHQWRAAT